MTASSLSKQVLQCSDGLSHSYCIAGLWKYFRVVMTSPAFHSASLPGKGVGVVASRLLSPGELLLAEAPLLLVPWWVRGVEYNRNK